MIRYNACLSNTPYGKLDDMELNKEEFKKELQKANNLVEKKLSSFKDDEGKILKAILEQQCSNVIAAFKEEDQFFQSYLTGI